MLSTFVLPGDSQGGTLSSSFVSLLLGDKIAFARISSSFLLAASSAAFLTFIACSAAICLSMLN